METSKSQIAIAKGQHTQPCGAGTEWMSTTQAVGQHTTRSKFVKLQLSTLGSECIFCQVCLDDRNYK